jgi:hypothetical protein
VTTSAPAGWPQYPQQQYAQAQASASAADADSGASADDVVLYGLAGGVAVAIGLTALVAVLNRRDHRTMRADITQNAGRLDLMREIIDEDADAAAAALDSYAQQHAAVHEAVQEQIVVLASGVDRLDQEVARIALRQPTVRAPVGPMTIASVAPATALPATLAGMPAVPGSVIAPTLPGGGPAVYVEPAPAEVVFLEPPPLRSLRSIARSWGATAVPTAAPASVAAPASAVPSLQSTASIARQWAATMGVPLDAIVVPVSAATLATATPAASGLSVAPETAIPTAVLATSGPGAPFTVLPLALPEHIETMMGASRASRASSVHHSAHPSARASAHPSHVRSVHSAPASARTARSSHARTARSSRSTHAAHSAAR